LARTGPCADRRMGAKDQAVSVMRRVVFTEAALDQLNSIFLYVAAEASIRTAERFVSDITDYCEGLVPFPERGQRRDELRPGLRLVGFRRQVTIAFRIDAEAVHILGVFYGGRDVEAAMTGRPPR